MNIITHFHSVHNTVNSYACRNNRSACCTECIAQKGSRAPPRCTNKKPCPGGHPDTANAKPTRNQTSLFCPFIIPRRPVLHKPKRAVLETHTLYKGELT